MPCSHAPSPFCPHSVSSLVSIPHPCPLSTCHPLLPAPSSHPSFTKSLQSPHSKFSSSFIPPDSNLLFQASLTHWELIQGFVVFFLSWAEGPGIYESWPSATAGMGVVKTDLGGRTRGRMLGKCFWGSQGGNGKWFSPVAPAQPLKVDTIPHKSQLFLQAGATINPTARAQV